MICLFSCLCCLRNVFKIYFKMMMNCKSLPTTTRIQFSLSFKPFSNKLCCCCILKIEHSPPFLDLLCLCKKKSSVERLCICRIIKVTIFMCDVKSQSSESSSRSFSRENKSLTLDNKNNVFPTARKIEEFLCVSLA